MFLQESDKGQISYWSNQTCSRIMLSINCCWPFSKNLKTALFQTFSTYTQILSALTALYRPSTAFYWPSTTKYQPVPPYTDPAPPTTNQCCLLRTMFHHVSTSTAFYWPRTIMYQPVLPSTDPVPPSTNQYHSILTWYHQVSTSTSLYCCCLGIADFCTVYPGSCSSKIDILLKTWIEQANYRFQNFRLTPNMETPICKWLVAYGCCKG